MPGGEHPLLTSYGVEVLHVNHHGSESSTNPDYMNLLTPKYACIATGSGQSPDYMFPRHDVVDNVLRAGVYCVTAPPAIVLQNEEGYPAGSLTSYTGYCLGDYTIKTAGAINYIINGNGAVTEGPDERAALGLPDTVLLDEPPSDTTAPAVTVIAPNGGESWMATTQHNITWTATDAVGVNSYAIDYSTNSGTNWISVQGQTSGNPHTYTWTVPSTSSSSCLVRIRAWDAAGNVGNDQSNAVFSIIPLVDTMAPLVHVTSPNGGENWTIGTAHNITWTATDNVAVTAYKLDYSINAGTSWLAIITWTTGNPGTYSWTIPNTPSGQSLIRVSCRDGVNNIGADNSDNNFTIVDPPPAVTVSSPNGGETWDCGSLHDITWTDSDNLGVTAHKLEYSTDGGSNWLIVRDWMSGDPHLYSWMIPSTPTALGRIRISCRDTSDGVGSDISNSNFTIRDLTAPVVTVISPNGGESLISGSNYQITWTATDNVTVTLYRIEYSIDGGSNWLSVTNWTAGNPGTYSWAVPSTLSTNCRVKVSSRDSSGNLGSDNSDSSFTIRDAVLPVVMLAAPNGGEIWDCGTQHNIVWTATDSIGIAQYKIEYSSNGGASWISPPIVDWTDGNPGTYPWVVPDLVINQAKIRVSCKNIPGEIGSDLSDGNFAFRDASAPTVNIINPNGGESFNLGIVVPISFTCSDNIGCSQSKFEYSTNGGSAWQLIRDWGSSDAPNWIPTSPGTQYRIKISSRDAANNMGIDSSEGDFAVVDITAPIVTLISPVGGETWFIGTTHNITWNAMDDFLVNQYKLEFSTDNGSSWIVPPIEDWTDGNPGAYSWLIPDMVSTNCRVRISCRDQAQNIGSDTSGASFTITQGSVGCDYQIGDINGNGTTNGIDVTYGVGFFKGGTPPPIACDMCPQTAPFYAAGDVNGSCVFNGIDITYFVVYLKGGASLRNCVDCPPAGSLSGQGRQQNKPITR
jgi:hypothetical protein